MDHRTRSHLLPNRRDRRCPFLGHTRERGCEGTEAQVQMTDGAQVPLNGPQRQPSLLAQCRNQAHQPDTEALPPNDGLGDGRFQYPALPAAGAAPLQIAMLDDLHRARHHLDDLPPPLDRAAKETDAAARTRVDAVLHDRRRGRTHACKAVGTTPTRLLAGARGRLRRLDARHPRRTAPARASLQFANARLQTGNRLVGRSELRQQFLATRLLLVDHNASLRSRPA